MANSIDFKKLYEKYMEEGVSRGVSITRFCEMNGVVYSQFERWYKKSRATEVKPVEIVDSDGLLPAGDVPSCQEAESAAPVTLSHVNLVFSNGLQVNHHNISYPAFRRLVERLEALC